MASRKPEPEWRAPPPEVGIASAASRVVGAYAFLAVLAAALSLGLQDGYPWLTSSPPWLPIPPGPWAPHVASTAGGLVIAVVFIVTSRLSVARFAWAQRLHLDLRPLTQGLTLGPIIALAVFSSLGEELLFRGLLQRWLGLLPAAVIFGLCHQVKGPARLVWVCWATGAGLAFGALFEASGSLVGPIFAHALINAINLRFLRDHDPLAPPG